LEHVAAVGQLRQGLHDNGLDAVGDKGVVVRRLSSARASQKSQGLSRLRRSNSTTGTASLSFRPLPKLLPGWKAAMMVRYRRQGRAGGAPAKRPRLAAPVALALLAAAASLAAAVSCEPVGTHDGNARSAGNAEVVIHGR
jgi:hypothetical protein